MVMCCCQNEEMVVDKQSDPCDVKASVLRRCPPPVPLPKQPVEVMVHVNVYSLLEQNKKLKKLGLGVYHTGVVVYGIEWGYGEAMEAQNATGLFCVYPGQAAGTLYRTLFLGVTTHSPQQVDTILHRLENEWRSRDYHILNHNCNHFAQRFCDILSTVQKLRIPMWCNRAARVCNRVVPKKLATYVYRLIDEEPPKAPAPRLSRVNELPQSVIPADWYLHPSVSQGPRYVPPPTPPPTPPPLPLLQQQQQQELQPKLSQDDVQDKVEELGQNEVHVLQSRDESAADVQRVGLWVDEMIDVPVAAPVTVAVDGSALHTPYQAHACQDSVCSKDLHSRVITPSPKLQEVSEVVFLSNVNLDSSLRTSNVLSHTTVRARSGPIEEKVNPPATGEVVSREESVTVPTDVLVETASNLPTMDNAHERCSHHDTMKEETEVEEDDEDGEKKEGEVVVLKASIIRTTNSSDRPEKPSDDAEKLSFSHDSKEQKSINDSITHHVDNEANNDSSKRAASDDTITNSAYLAMHSNENKVSICSQEAWKENLTHLPPSGCAPQADAVEDQSSSLGWNKEEMGTGVMREKPANGMASLTLCSALDAGERTALVGFEEGEKSDALKHDDSEWDDDDDDDDDEYSDPGCDEDVSMPNTNEMATTMAGEVPSPARKRRRASFTYVAPKSVLYLRTTTREHKRSQSGPF